MRPKIVEALKIQFNMTGKMNLIAETHGGIMRKWFPVWKLPPVCL